MKKIELVRGGHSFKYNSKSESYLIYFHKKRFGANLCSNKIWTTPPMGDFWLHF